jgi:tetratricopeptide (TPR) repeat protein
MVVLGLIMGMVGCAESKPIAIPPEWQVPPRSSAATPAPSKSETTAASEAVLKPAPTIEERDISGGVHGSAPTTAGKAEQAEPQQVASLHLVDTANAHLKKGNADEAVRILEQAIQVDSYNGDAFFGLARAWRMKGSREKAMEFSTKAEILFQDEPVKLREVYLFKADLFEEIGDRDKNLYYRKKAERL